MSVRPEGRPSSQAGTSALGAWLSAQGRAAQLLALAFDVPLLGRLNRLVTPPPRVEPAATVAGVPTLVARPGRGEAWPALVFLNGVTARGRFHPDVERLARALARVGFLVLVPDPPGLASGELGEPTLEAAIGVVEAAAGRRDARGGRVGLFGVSVGVLLALRAAEQPELAGRVSVVAGIAPYLDFRNVARLATTGHLLEQGQLVRHPVAPFMAIVAARSLVAALPPSAEREALLAELGALGEDEPRPLERFRGLAETGRDAETRAVAELLANEDPQRVEGLLAALPAAVRRGLDRLSALSDAAELRAPIELASAPEDKYLPLSEARAFALAASQTSVRLTVSSALEHAVPRLSPRELVSLARFDGFAVRVLRAARASVPPSGR